MNPPLPCNRESDGDRDVVVVGGGPAGLAAAIALARDGHRCVVLEKSDYGQFRIGETLPAAAQSLLVELGLWDRFLAEGYLPSHAVASSWGDSALATNHAICNPLGPGWHIDRLGFDRLLRCAAEEAGAEVLRSARLSRVERTGTSWNVRFAHRGKERDLSAATLIDATGSHSHVARRLGARRLVYDRLAGISVSLPPSAATLVEQEGDAQRSGFLLLEACAGGWFYSVPLPSGELLVVFVTEPRSVGREAATQWRNALATTSHTRLRCTGYEHREHVGVWPIMMGRLDRACGPGWIAVGDAASTFDPLAAVGIAKALRDGLDAARLIACGEPEEEWRRYDSRVAERFEAYLLDRAKYYAAEPRWAMEPFWQRRGSCDHQAMSITLAATERLVLAGSRDSKLPVELANMVSSDEWTILSRLVEVPRPAHELVAALRRDGSGGAADRRIVLALQQMVDLGVLRADATDTFPERASASSSSDSPFAATSA